MKLYGVIDYRNDNNDDLWPVQTEDFAEYLKLAQEYARKVFPKRIADAVIKMLPSLECGEIERIELNTLVFRVTEVEVAK